MLIETDHYFFFNNLLWLLDATDSIASDKKNVSEIEISEILLAIVAN